MVRTRPRKREQKQEDKRKLRKKELHQKTRLPQMVMKDFLRTFRYYFWGRHIEEYGIKHNHIKFQTKLSRVKDMYLNQFNVPEALFEAHKAKYFELMLPSRKDNKNLMKLIPKDQRWFIKLMRETLSQRPNLINVRVFLRDPAICALYGYGNDAAHHGIKTFKHSHQMQDLLRSLD